MCCYSYVPRKEVTKKLDISRFLKYKEAACRFSC